MNLGKMTVTWELDGKVYHENKDKFKSIRSESSMRFLGFDAMAWENDREHVKLDRITDVDNDGREFTVGVTLIWKGRKETGLLRGMRELFNQIAENVRVEGVVKTPEQIKEDTLKAFDSETDFIAGRYEIDGLGQGWIRCYMGERTEKREHLFDEEKPKEEVLDEGEIKVRKFMEKNHEVAFCLEELGIKFPKIEDIKRILESMDEVKERNVDGVVYYNWRPE